MSDPENDVQVLQLARADAIQAYAALEQGLCTLFGALLGGEMPVAGIIFYRIVNTRTQNTIISELLAHRHKKKYEPYWDSILSILRSVDQQRNELVHWHISTRIDIDAVTNRATRTRELIPPNYWGRTPNSASMTPEAR